MNDERDPSNQEIRVGEELCGYRVEKITRLTELNAVLYRLVHKATGAQHVHISTEDRENTFAVTFKTIPTDSTGVAHILEHTVLCGSQKYPVRDPFFSMLKRSMSTFMNAFTASDWTMYPFATQNAKDYYNLMDVYLDAAFFPKLDELSFKQEGHRLEVERLGKAGKTTELVYKGVVYNEMKGAMSSPDQVLARSLLNALYPETTYCNNSGGEPADIPKLTHGQLKAFHQRHYHPSNAFFYTYGNLPLQDHLIMINEKIMRHFDPLDPKTTVPEQPRWSAPKQVRYTYPLAPNEDASHKCQVCLAWLTCDIRDTFEVLVLAVLEQILLGNPASPLRKALMDSGLGSALSDATGYDADNRDTLFACGLKDVLESSGQAIEQLILDVLEQLTANGLDPESISSAIHQIEFHRKEITNTPYPYGIKLLLTLIGSWLHGGDPERILQLDDDLQRLHREIKQGPFLEQRIRHYFLENTHRIRLTLAPDQQQSKKEEARVRQELDERMVQLTQADLEQIAEDTGQLAKMQDQHEDISCLPTLALSDIPNQVPIYKPTRIEADLPLWRYVQPTSGIFYFYGAAGAAALPADLLPWVPFFCYAFTKIGTQSHDYIEVARKIDAATGGLTLSAHARVLSDRTDSCLPLVSMNAKCLNRNVEPMFDIAAELISEAKFSDLVRLKQLLGEYRAALDAMIVQNGHRLAISLSARNFSPASALSEIWGGVHQIQTIRAFSKGAEDAQLEKLAADLAIIGQAIFTSQNFVMAAIGEAEPMETAVKIIRASETLAAFKKPQQPLRLPSLDFDFPESLPHEGWSTSTAVAFVAQTLPTVPLGHADAPALSVLSKMLRSLYLHREIREKGGAYGGFALYNPENGLFSLASYRDPHIARTLEIYSGATEFMQKGQADSEDIKEAILQVCSEIDKPDPPGPAARKAFARSIIGLSDETRIAFKQKLLKVSKEEVLDIAARYLGLLQSKSGIAVIADQEHLKEANVQLAQKPLQLKII